MVSRWSPWISIEPSLTVPPDPQRVIATFLPGDTDAAVDLLVERYLTT